MHFLFFIPIVVVTCISFLPSGAHADHAPGPADVCHESWGQTTYELIRFTEPLSEDEIEDGAEPRMFERLKTWLTNTEETLDSVRWNRDGYPSSMFGKRSFPVVVAECKDESGEIPPWLCRHLAEREKAANAACEVTLTYPECKRSGRSGDEAIALWSTARRAAVNQARSEVSKEPLPNFNDMMVSVAGIPALAGYDPRLAKALARYAVVLALNEAAPEFAALYRGHVYHRDCAETLATVGLDHALADVGVVQDFNSALQSTVSALFAAWFPEEPTPTIQFTIDESDEAIAWLSTNFGNPIDNGVSEVARMRAALSDIPAYFRASDDFITNKGVEIDPLPGAQFRTMWVFSPVFIDSYQISNKLTRLQFADVAYDDALATLMTGYDSFPSDGFTLPDIAGLDVAGTLIHCFEQSGEWSEELLDILDDQGRLTPFLQANPDTARLVVSNLVASTIICSGRWARADLRELRVQLFPGNSTVLAEWIDATDSQFHRAMTDKANGHANRAREFRATIAAIQRMLP